MLQMYGQKRMILGKEYTFERLTRSGRHHPKVRLRTAVRLLEAL